MLKLFKKNITNNKKGFTLVELLVTIVIFVILTGVVLVNSNQFDNSILLHNFAYDVALTIKQAQSYGVNVKENNFGTFDSSYGVYFNLDTSSDGSLTNYILFASSSNDTAINTVLKCTTDSSCLQKYTMTKGTQIDDICAGDDDLHCNSIKDTNGQISIWFHRPSLDANISTGQALDPQSYAKITLSATNGATSSVIVTKLGQIYIKE